MSLKVILSSIRIKYFFLELQMDLSAGIEAEYHHKNSRVSFGS